MHTVKLFSEAVENVEYICEAQENGPKKYSIRGPFMQAEVKNRNGRIYPMPVLAKEVEKYNEKIDELEKQIKIETEKVNPIREKRKDLESNMSVVEDSLLSGIERTRSIASDTIEQVKEAMKISRYTKSKNM